MLSFVLRTSGSAKLQSDRILLCPVFCTIMTKGRITMKYRRNWFSLLLALAMAGSLAGCGSEKEELSSETETTAAVQEDEEDEASPEDYLKETDDPEDDKPIDLEEIVVGTQETKTSETAKTSETSQTTGAQTAAQTASATSQTATAAGSQQQDAPAETEAPAADTGSNTASSAAQPAATQPATTQAPTQAPTEAPTEPPTEAPTEPPTEIATEPIDPEDVVMALIDLNTMTIEGSGAAVNGNVISITETGTYIVSGYLPDGMIEVNTTMKVKLKLNGADITNSTGPAVMVTDAKRLTMTLIEGTVNSLTGGSVANDGAICTNDTLEIKGAGTLYVNGTVEHGISSDDDIVVKNGDIYVNAVKTGMMANDDITVSGGTLHVTGGTNGMKSKGTMHIAGGTLWVTGGPKETKSGLYSATSFTVTGGYIYVIGCDATAPDAATSTQNALAVKFVPSLAGGSSACVSSGGAVLFDAYSDMAYNTVFICSPDIWDGMEFNVSANGADCGVFNTAGMMTTVTAATS